MVPSVSDLTLIILLMGFKGMVDSLLPVVFCHLCVMIPRAISGCQERTLNREFLINGARNIPLLQPCLASY